MHEPSPPHLPCAGSAARPQLGTLPNMANVPELPLLVPGSTALIGSQTLMGPAAPSRQGPLSTVTPIVTGQSAQFHLAQYDPTAAVPPKLVKKILDLEFVEMRELLPEAWQDDPQTAPDSSGQRRHAHRPPISDILTWLECFGRMAAILCTKYPEKSTELWAYQSSILRAAKNFEGQSWVAYDRQYRREALSRRDLNWSALDSRLYSEAFTGRAKAVLRCRHCLGEGHTSAACPASPFSPDQSRAGAAPKYPESKEPCRKYNEGRCTYPYCKYRHVCKECSMSHPWISCYRNPSAPQFRHRPRSPRRPYNRGAAQ